MPAQGPSNCRNLLPKGSRPGFGPNGPFLKGPRRKFHLPAQGPSNCRNLRPKGSRPGFGPKRAFPKGILIAGPRALKVLKFIPKGSWPGFGRKRPFPNQAILSPPKVGSHIRSSMVGFPNAFVRVVNLLEPSRVSLRMKP